MATSDGAASTPGDPYATSKANLRDTIKWLAGIFGALAAAVVAGAPVSGLGALRGTPAFWQAGVALLIGFGCICAALILSLRLLRSDFLYASDIDPRVAAHTRDNPAEIGRIRAAIDTHAIDLLPAGFDSMASFLARVDEGVAQAKRTYDAVNQLDESVPGDAAAIEAGSARYAEQQAVVREYRAAQQRVMAYASYLRFYERLRRSTVWLLLLGVGALLALAVFGVEVQGPKEEKAPSVVVIPMPLAPTQPASAAAGRNVLPPVFFATGSALITPQARSAIERARNIVNEHKGVALLVMARTDTVGSSRRNESLAHERGAAVRRLLVENGGLSPSQVFVAELPKNDLPRLTGSNEENLENRTVTMQIVDFGHSSLPATAQSTSSNAR